MGSGLKKMLEAICDDPGNLVLRDRFLTLVAELPDGIDKANHVLDLASAMKEIEPEFSLRLSYYVHEYDREWGPPLALIADIFDYMQRPGKAEVIRNHIAELLEIKKDQTFQPHDSHAKFPTHLKEELQNPTFDVENSIVASIEKHKKSRKDRSINLNSDDHGRFDLSEVSLPSPPPPSVIENMAVEDLENSSDDEQFKPTFVLEPAEVPPPVIKDRDVTRVPPSQLDKMSAPPPSSLEDGAPLFRESRVDARSKRKGIQERGVIENPEEVRGFIFDQDNDSYSPPLHDLPRGMQKNKQSKSSPRDGYDEASRMPEQIFDFYWKQGFFDKAAHILEQSKRFAAHQEWWQNRAMLLQSHSPHHDYQVQGEDHFESLEKEIKDLLIKVRSLCRSSKNRKALYEIFRNRHEIRSELAAESIYRELTVIWKHLGLRGFKWDTSIPLSRFKENLQQRSMPTMAAIACGEKY